MRVNKIITYGKNASILYQILLTNSVRKCTNQLENMSVDIGAYFMNHTFSFVIQHPRFNLHTS